MSNFDKAFLQVVGIEGGYVSDPDDRGGETKFGISKRSYPHLDIRNLSLEQAKQIYYEDFWKDCGLDAVDDYQVAHEIFDTSVNMGQVIAKKIFQKALNYLNRNERDFPDLIVDGIIGAKTINAYRRVDNRILLKVLNGLQFMRYTQIVDYDPRQEKFFNGWMQRI